MGLPESCLIYAGGGSILALLPDDTQAERLATRLQAQYTDVTTLVTLTAVWQTFPANQLSQGYGDVPSQPPTDPTFTRLIFDPYRAPFGAGANFPRKSFGDIVLYMGTRLRHAKQNRQQTPVVDSSPFAQVCPSCQMRPVSHVSQVDDGTYLLRCRVCENKRQRGRVRGYWLDKLYDSIAHALPDGVSMPLRDRLTYPQDITTMTGGQHVAFVYADGDAMGDYLLRHGMTPDGYRKQSDRIEQYTHQAVAYAIAQTFAAADFGGKLNRDEDGRLIVSWEVITIGGDDVLMLVKADRAFDFVVNLVRHFDELARKGSGSDQLTLSAGFAIAQPSTPVRLLRDTAKKVLRNAKRRRYRLQHDTGEVLPCMDYHSFVKEGYPLADFEKIRPKLKDDVTRLTGRPYTLPEAEILQAGLDELRRVKFPRSQLYSLGGELQRGVLRGSVYYDYQFARLHKDYRDAMRTVAQHWAGNEWPWLIRPTGTNEPDQRYTVLLDMVNLLQGAADD